MKILGWVLTLSQPYCWAMISKEHKLDKMENMEDFQDNSGSRRTRILVAASGSVAAMKFANLCQGFCEWGEVKAVATKSSLHFIDRASLSKDITLYTDEEEWSSWKKLGDSVLHIELRQWADIMVIAPLSANTLGKAFDLVTMKTEDMNFIAEVELDPKCDTPLDLIQSLKRTLWNAMDLSCGLRLELRNGFARKF